MLSRPRCRALFNTLKRVSLPRRSVSNVHPVKLRQEVPVEEEALPNYEAEQYYPVRVGDLFNARYRVAGKLGYGAYSTANAHDGA